MANILLVEDYEDFANSMARWLKLCGHDVQIARNGYQAIDMARGELPNFVLLDIGLPYLDGYHVASRIRQELGALTIIIAITGYGQEEDRRRAYTAGCDYHLLKPIDKSALVALLATSVTRPDSPMSVSRSQDT